MDENQLTYPTMLPDDEDENYYEDSFNITNLSGLNNESSEESSELEYEYEPGISLATFEFARTEAEKSKNPFLDIASDLQLAAELGKTLLERNKELESVIKQHKSIIDDQAQEIDFLTKQNIALREINESRLKVYEQLEVSISNLEDVNRILVENSKVDKIRNKNLTKTVSRLETEVDELLASLNKSDSETGNNNRKSRKDKRKSLRLSESYSNKEIETSFVKTENENEKETLDSISSPGGSEKECSSGYSSVELLRLWTSSDSETEYVTHSLPSLILDVEQNEENETNQVSKNFKNEFVNLDSLRNEVGQLKEVRDGKLCINCLEDIQTPYGNIENPSKEFSPYNNNESLLFSTNDSISLQEELKNARKTSFLTRDKMKNEFLFHENVPHECYLEIELCNEMKLSDPLSPIMSDYSRELISENKFTQTTRIEDESSVDILDNYKTIFREIFAVLQNSKS